MLKNIALVTGGAGFIGSHLCERLLLEGMRVVVVDNLSTGSKYNIQGLHQHPDFTFVVGNITDEKLMGSLIEQCDIVYHLAAAVGVKLIMDQPLLAMKTNIRGTEIVLDVASKFKRSVFIASSSEVYGKGTQVPFSESDDTLIGPTEITRWSYAGSKAVDEFLALAYCREMNMDIKIARFFNTVGPRQSERYGMVIPRFVKQAINDDPISVHGSGEQTRTFNHVLDTVDATFRLTMDSSASGRVYNIGGVTEISMMKLAEKIKERTNSTSPIFTIPYDAVYKSGSFEDMPRRVPDISRLDQQIGYQPTRSLNDIIDQVASHFMRPAAVA